MLSYSAITRGIVTALHWLGHTGSKAFRPVDYEMAFQHVQMPKEQYATVLRKALEMKKNFVGTARVLTTEQLLQEPIAKLREKENVR